MKGIALRIVVSIIIVISTVLLVNTLTEHNHAEENGQVRIIIVDENDITVFDDNISFEKGDDFFDVLNRSFDLTCATSSYQPDTTCSYSFDNLAYNGKVLLGISNSEFNILTNWSDSFLAFEVYDEPDFYLSTQGVSNIEFKDGDQIRIVVKSVLGGLS